MKSLRESVLKYGSFMLVFFSPFVFWGHALFPHISSKTFFIYAVIEVVFFVWLYEIIIDTKYRLNKKSLLFFLVPFSFVIWMTVTGIFAVNPSLSFWSSLGRGTGLLMFYHVFALSLIVASLTKLHGLNYIQSLFKWLISGASVLSVSIWLGSEGFNLNTKVLTTDNGGGLSGNSTLAATYMLFSFASIFFLLLSKKVESVWKKILIIVFLFIFCSPMFFNLFGMLSGKTALGSARGTIISLFAGIVFSGLSYFFFSSKKIIKWSSFSVFILGLLSFVVLWMQLITTGTYLNQKFAEEARGSRFIFWETASVAISKHPYLGYGPENYMLAFQENFNPKILETSNSMEGWADRAHNIYYDLGVAGGYPMIVLYTVFILSIFYSVFLLYKKQIFSRSQLAVFFGLFVAYLLNNLLTFDSNLSLLALFLFVGLFYGLQDSDVKKVKTDLVNPDLKIFISIGLMIACVFSLIYFVKMPASKSAAYADIFIMPVNVRSSSYSKLLEGSHVGEDWDVSGLADDIHKKYSLNPLSIKSDPKLLPHVIVDITNLLKYLDVVALRNPEDYRLMITRAHLSNTLLYLTDTTSNKETFDRILGILNDAKKLSPTNPNVNWSRAQVYVWAGDFESAKNQYREAIAIDPTFASSHRLLIQFAQIIGDKNLYDESLAQAEKYIPGFQLKK